MTIEEFIEKCQKRPLPSNPMARVKFLARELVEGLHYELWENRFYIFSDETFIKENEQQLLQYLEARWKNSYPKSRLLVLHNYFRSSIFNMSTNTTVSILTEKALNLLEEAEPALIFISYKRSESSAFALLIHDRLEAMGLEPFVDMQLEIGQLWEDELEKKIRSVDYFMLLLGRETLKSAVTIKEILWANDAEKTILIIRHNGFSFKDVDWTIIPDETRDKVKGIIEKTHSIAVLEENPSEYNSTLDRIINFFQFAETKTE